MKTILELTNVKAKKYFLESENYCNMQFPKYIDFKPILDYVQDIIGKRDLNSIKKSNPEKYDDVNYKIIVKKDSLYSYRSIQLINPYLYYLLVKEITTKRAWDEIKNRFIVLSVPNIEVASIPKVKDKKDKSHLSVSVSSWWESVEQRSLELALSYRYMFVTDIANCYASIYTHAVAWAMMDKNEAKEKAQNRDLLGNKIDYYLRCMQYGQTNGITQGSVLSDFIAEIILAYTDKELSDKLNKENIKDYHIIRYRDDYRVYSNSKEEIERIAFYLQETLSEFNFHLNAKKTYLTEDIISNSIKPDKLNYIFEGPIYRESYKRIYTTLSSLQQEALFIHQFSKRYPNSGILLKLLNTFFKRLNTKIANCGNLDVLISIFTEVAFFSPKTYKVIIAIISKLISKIETSKQQQIVSAIYEKFKRLPNIGEIQIWMQRISYNMSDIKYDEGICRVVNKEGGVVLWNNEWVKDEYKKDFPQFKICTEWLNNEYTPIIEIDEVSLFNNYNT